MDETETKVLPYEYSLPPYRSTQEVDRGTYGVVYNWARSKDDPVPRIIKCIPIVECVTSRIEFDREVAITLLAEKRKFGPRGIQYGMRDNGQKGFIIAEKGVPLKTLHRDTVAALWPRAKKAILEMHMTGVFHQDLQLISNFILYDKEDIRIIDYGFAYDCGEDIKGTVAAAFDYVTACLAFSDLIANYTPDRLLLYRQMIDECPPTYRAAVDFVLKHVIVVTNTVAYYGSIASCIEFVDRLMKELPVLRDPPEGLEKWINDRLIVRLRFDEHIDLYQEWRAAKGLKRSLSGLAGTKAAKIQE